MSSAEEPATRKPGIWWSIVGGSIVPIAILAAWWAVSAAGVVSPRLLPSPQEVVSAGVDLAGRGLLAGDVAASVQRVVTGFLAGSAVGLLLGAGMRASLAAAILFSPVIAAMRAVPTVAWLPALLLYLGVGEGPKIVLIAIGAALPVFKALAGPADGSPGPSALTIVSGLRAALVQSWAFLVTAELLHATVGLGFLLVDSSAAGRPDRLIVGIVLIVILARLADLPFALVERRLRRTRGGAHSGALPCAPPSSNGEVTPS